ncbi:hypothetical protein AVHY2522_22915 [Acidovorax sp. SUPP2522]|uniref:hypothetical protein n=1 Tax=unclassified Acidovorax TaxID=2684926 RepID=UPI00234BEEA9|nr:MULTISPECIES: hypothetical protein [unclassified Acidovorax]WCM95721.1 hypothetical protein M5C96_14660 [Acidovorax sp. GBBC 1281]GKT19557.1 hypothetical protein AVHY2522_22915 [Acidovorax sp. SUPP2522]
MAGLSFALPGGGGLNLGLGGLPPLQFSSSAASGLDNRGANYSASGAGDWVVNLGGSGTALQAASGGINWLLVAAAVGATWLLMRK